ncbi:MAG: trypsin-like peptidase domain-containing protein [Planctomycetes bacterium]|nr:trypsin-like peptidase domain-containing protein [Planctomycetota bacterium]
MNKIIAAVAVSLMLGGAVSLAENTAPKPNDTVAKRDAEVIALTAQVYPAFVMLGGGSGICISEDGYFLTNHHVFNEAAAPAKVAAKMAGNSRKFTADAVGADPRGDIVLGKLRLEEGEKVPFVPLADSDKLEIGDLCLSIGNPFLLNGNGSEPTVTFGTVTAVHRFQGGYADSIEIDTAINPGNSGGPSFNINGEMIGINGRNIASHGKRYNTGAGFAIPANQIKNFLDALKAESGGAYVVRHGLIGGLDLDLSSQEGAVVRGVEANSDASDAGFEPKDVITAVDGKTAFNGYRFLGITQTKPRGSSFVCTVKRGDKVMELTATNSVPTESGQFGTVPRPDDEARKGGGGMQAMFGDPFKLPPMKSSLGFKGEYNDDRKVGGYKITSIKAGSPLLDTGMEEGDVLTKVNGRTIFYFADLHDILIATPEGTEVTVTWLHNGEEMTATVKTAKAK